MDDRRTGRLVSVAAVLWGLAEATVFFIVPDVLLSALALRSPRGAVRGAILVLAGAVAGGVAMVRFAASDPEAARALVLAVPGISEAAVARARGLLEGGLLEGMVVGSLSGLPYKIFAVEAGATGVSPWLFALVSVPARLLRFLLVVGATSLLSRTVFARLSDRAKFAVLGVFWVGFYAVYFSMTGW